jgi:hypothetical protein
MLRWGDLDMVIDWGEIGVACDSHDHIQDFVWTP